MKKKVGIVTVTYVNNFGSHLQSFALQESLDLIGVDAEIINYNSVKKQVQSLRRKYLLSRLLDFSELRAYYPRMQRALALRFDKDYKRKYCIRKQQIDSFCLRYRLSEKVEGFKGLTELCKKSYSSVIVGSDQNWRPANIAGRFYTLGFVPEEINKISYSTSFGISRVIKQQKKYARWFLSRINYISVREETGRALVQELIGREAQVVCDPTLLLSANQWNDYIGNERIIEKKYILCYFLGTSIECRKFAMGLKKETGLHVIAILNGERYYKEKTVFYDEEVNDIGPFDFVRLIRDADYICTDSFHGCAFSLIFRKQFFPFYKFAKNGKMSSNSRLDTMLQWSGVGAERIVTPKTDVSSILSKTIDYSNIENRINEMIEKSYAFLQNAISEGEAHE